MAVVVNLHGNHYYTHRIVLPDGSHFTFQTRTDAMQEPNRGVTVTSSLADSTSIASKKSVAQQKPRVKQKMYSHEYIS